MIVDQTVYDYTRRSDYNPLPALETIAEMTGLDPWEIASKSRHARLIKARHLWWACMRKEGNWSYPEIANYVERDHSTVMRAIKRVPPNVVEAVKKYQENR